MEPRFFKRGNLFGAICRHVNRERFNGATFFQTWKLSFFRRFAAAAIIASMEPRFFKRGNSQVINFRTVTHNGASMEPRFFKRGNSKMSSTLNVIRVTLQWSHVFSNVEITPHGSKLGVKHSASMEPRFFKRGNSQITRLSMGL